MTTKTLRRRFFSLAGRITRSARRAHPASSPELALGNPIQSRPGPTASHSTPGLTAPSATELPTAQPKIPAKSRPPWPAEFPLSLSHKSPSLIYAKTGMTIAVDTMSGA